MPLRVTILQKTTVEGLVGMLEDFLGIVRGNVGETDKQSLNRVRLSTKALDDELIKTCITKQNKRICKHRGKP